jgi:hypothetical protein
MRFSWTLCLLVSTCPSPLPEKHTCGGPRMVPFQSDIKRSSPLSSPYEHASAKFSASIPNHIWHNPYQHRDLSRPSLAPRVIESSGGPWHPCFRWTVVYVLIPGQGGLYPAIDEALEALRSGVGTASSGEESIRCIDIRGTMG